MKLRSLKNISVQRVTAAAGALMTGVGLEVEASMALEIV